MAPSAIRLRILIKPIAVSLLLICFAHVQRLQGQSPQTNSTPPQASSEKLAFEVASVRPNQSDDDSYSAFPLGRGAQYAVTGGHFRAKNIILLYYISFAYRLTSSQEASLEHDSPRWIVSDRFDIDARSENQSPTKDEMREMMKSLLADRFHLVMHIEMRQEPVFALVLTKPGETGPQLKPHPADEPCSATTLAQPTDSEPAFKPAVGGGFPRSCGGLAQYLKPSIPGCLRAGARNIPIQLLADTLPEMGDLTRPAIDRTGLPGNYDFILEWAPEPNNVSAADQEATLDAPCPKFEEALKEQLGLKIASQTGQVEEYVLDHVEHPTPN
jgi:uncharacterized protein (TIGR03435 family)